MTKTEHSKLKKNLPKGWCKTLSDKYQHPKVYIYKIISGERNNPAILQDAIHMAAENKLTQLTIAQQIKEKIKSLL